MPVHFDPTEKMPGTHLPDSFFDLASPLEKLEHFTGADILITVEPFSFTKILDIPPHRSILRKACLTGDLIQRKSGNDLLSSIPDLPLIEARMLEWSPRPTLMVARIRMGRKGQLIVDGGRSIRHNWNKVSGALDAWKDRGGVVKRIEYDVFVTGWIELRQRRLLKYVQEPVKHACKSHRRQQIKIERRNWLWTLGAWPRGIGPRKLLALGGYLEAQGKSTTLTNAITLATSNEVLKVPGWGKATLQSVRNWYGVVEESISIGDVITIGGKQYIIDRVPLGTRSEPGVIPEGAVILKEGS